MTQNEKKAIVRNWTTEYAEILKHNRWYGRLTFGHDYMGGGVLYTKSVKVQEDVIESAYKIVLGRVLTTVDNIESGR